jgi:limonene-1,2-epoxide hydrolase
MASGSVLRQPAWDAPALFGCMGIWSWTVFGRARNGDRLQCGSSAAPLGPSGAPLRQLSSQETAAMSTPTPPDPLAVIERMQTALNHHDLDAFVDCMQPDYDSQQPQHPDRAFRGREQVRKNWSTVFTDIPGFHADVLRSAVAGEVVWSEWHWHGARADGGQFDWRGVTIMGVRDGRIAWARLYMDAVEAGSGIDAAVRSMGHGSPEA